MIANVQPEAARQEDGEEKSEQPTPSSVSKLPQEAIEKLQMARVRCPQLHECLTYECSRHPCKLEK